MQKKILKTYVKFIPIAIIFIALAVFLAIYFKNSFNIEHLKLYILSFGNLAALIFILAFVLRSLFVFIPASVMVVLSGTLFGPIYGAIISLVSIFLSATFAFYLTRILGENFARKILKNKTSFIDNKLELFGIRIIVIMRASFLVPFDILSYGAGLTKIKYSSFIIGTLIGTFPEVLSLTYLGNNLDQPFSLNFLLAIVFVIITIIVPIIINKFKTRTTEKNTVIKKTSSETEPNKNKAI